MALRRLVPSAAASANASTRWPAPRAGVESPRSAWRRWPGRPICRIWPRWSMLGTVAATVADYVFKASAVESLEAERRVEVLRHLLRGVSLLASSSRRDVQHAGLERLGLGVTASTPSLALVVGGAGGLVVPGLQGAMMARAGESIFRASLFKNGYEIFSTHLSAGQACRQVESSTSASIGWATLVGGGLSRCCSWAGGDRGRRAAVHGRFMISVGCYWQRCGSVAATLARSSRALEPRAWTLTWRSRRLHPRTLIRDSLQSRGGFAAPAPSANGARDAESIAHSSTIPRCRDPGIAVAGRRSRAGRCRRAMSHATLVPHVNPAAGVGSGGRGRGSCAERGGRGTGGGADSTPCWTRISRSPFDAGWRACSPSASRSARPTGCCWASRTSVRVRFQCGRSLAAVVEKNGMLRIDRERVFGLIRRGSGRGPARVGKHPSCWTRWRAPGSRRAS